MSRFLISLGVVLVITGVLWPWFKKMGLGKLPGDMIINIGSVKLYFPITTYLLISIITSLVLWLIGHLFK